MTDLSRPSNRVLLGGVPRVGYESYEWCPFSACLTACLTYLGEEVTYEVVLGTSGAAFRLQWNAKRWDLGNVGILHMATDALEPFRRAFAAVGYGHEVILRTAFAQEHGISSGEEDEDCYRTRIIESIRDRGCPVIAIGVVGPPEPCIIAGYDEHSDVLIGWSFFQDRPPEFPDQDFEPSGYFRRRDWFRDTHGLILIRDKRQRPPLAEIYHRSLEWALVVARTPRIRDHHSGPAAYRAWAEAMTRDEDFPQDDVAVLRDRLGVHYDAMCMVNQRERAATFLRQIADHERAMADDLRAAADCYHEENATLGKMHEATGGYIAPNEDEKLKRLADPSVRRQMAKAILQARDKDAEAVDHIERALAK